MCDKVSLKPPVFTWLGTPYEYGFVPPSTLDDEFMSHDDMDKFFVPYLPQTIDAAKEADIFTHLGPSQRLQVVALIQEFEDCFTGDFNDVDVV